MFRCEFPFVGSEHVFGLWMGVDYTHTMVASYFLLSRKQMGINEASGLLASTFSISADIPVIHK